MRWQLVSIPISGKETSSKKQMKLVNVQADTLELIDILTDDISELALHLHIANWQHAQFQLHEANCHNIDGQILQVMDFGQNYLCTFRDEAKSAHWAHNQATIHPIVCYYQCPYPNCKEKVREDITCISSDLKHDMVAVAAFDKAATEHLENRRGLTITSKVQYSDGCSGQYKSANAFHDISKKPIKVQRNYFGSGHGKGPSDAVTGYVKNAARRAVRTGDAVIGDAKGLFLFTQSKLDTPPIIHNESRSAHKYVTSLFFDKINRSFEYDAYKTVQGTRKIHCVENTGNINEIVVRNLSCTCGTCENDCKNSNHVDPPRITKLVPKPPKQKHDQLRLIHHKWVMYWTKYHIIEVSKIHRMLCTR